MHVHSWVREHSRDLVVRRTDGNVHALHGRTLLRGRRRPAHKLRRRVCVSLGEQHKVRMLLHCGHL